MSEEKVIIRLNLREGGYHPLPKNMRESKGKIASEFKKVNGRITRELIRGLKTNEQEQYLLPTILSMKPSDNHWQKAVEDFWAEYEVKIDLEKGKKILDIRISNKEVTLIGGQKVTMDVPENLHDYMDYNFAMQSSRVAKTDEEKTNSDLYDFLLDDLSIIRRGELDLLEEKDLADTNYVDLISSKRIEKIDWLLEKLKDPSENYANAAFEDKKMALRKIKDETPSKFNEEYSNPDLEYEAELFKMIQFNIITVEGNTVLDGNINMGQFYKEAVAYLKDKTKSDHVLKLKERLKSLTGTSKNNNKIKL